tara:strand:+ start:768 stop:1970 length:1203 start_codon:yes stop_codon:yes gene_type:complete
MGFGNLGINQAVEQATEQEKGKDSKEINIDKKKDGGSILDFSGIPTDPNLPGGLPEKPEDMIPSYESLPDWMKKKEKKETGSEVKPWKNPWEKNLIRDGRRGPSQRMPSDLRYPYSTIDGTQDFLKFSVFEYKRSVRTAQQLSKRNQNSFISSGRESLSQEQGNLRDTRDLLGSVILPIPAQLADTNSTAWGESRMNQLESSLYGAAVGGIQGQGEQVRDSFQNALGTLSANQNMVASYFAKQAVNSLIGGNITLDQLMARNQGEILNPNLELLFSGPTLRNFTFNFKLTPRYEKEAQIIRTIIKSFKRNMAPKGSGGTVLRTPNVFQIEYMGRAKDYLNRMKICALKNVAVNYTGDGTFATYKDGAPISSMLTLSFTELTPIYNEDYAGYDNNEDGVGF